MITRRCASVQALHRNLPSHIQKPVAEFKTASTSCSLGTFSQTCLRRRRIGASLFANQQNLQHKSLFPVMRGNFTTTSSSTIKERTITGQGDRRRRFALLLLVVGASLYGVDKLRHEKSENISSDSQKSFLEALKLDVLATTRVFRLVGGIGRIIYGYKWVGTKFNSQIKNADSELARLTHNLVKRDEELATILDGLERDSSAATKFDETTRQHISHLVDAIDSLRHECNEALHKLEAAKSMKTHEMAIVHQTAADILLEVCKKNGGVYVKLGQHLGTLDYLLPEQYVSTMRGLFNQNTESRVADVIRLLEEELQQPLHSLFSNFDMQPIGSASLAQVHKAVDITTGKPVAIKIQHPGIRELSTLDIKVVTTAVDLIAWLFPEFQYQWLADELQKNLPLELDFLHEAKNADRCRELFKDSKNVVIPEIDRLKSTKRVLTMSFEEGVFASDTDGLARMGLDKDKVASLISTVFCQQMFIHGFVHCDPHPANVLIRPLPSAPKEPQLVLLDHGLYRQLEDEFRLDYARLWQALVLSDVEKIELYCRKMGGGDMYRLLASMLTARPWNYIEESSITHLKRPDSDDESKRDVQTIRTYANQYIKEIGDILARVPPSMLLLFKTTDCLRHIDRQLGTPVNTFVITARTCLEAINKDDQNKNPSWATILTSLGRSVQFESRILLLKAYMWSENALSQYFKSKPYNP